MLQTQNKYENEPKNFEKERMINDLQVQITNKIRDTDQEDLLLGAFGNEEKKGLLTKWIEEYLQNIGNNKVSATELVNRICGLMFIEEILKDENITDISFNGTDVYVQHNQNGRYKYDRTLTPNEVELIINKIANSINRNCNASEPILDAEYPRLRINATYKTIAPYGQTFSLRTVSPKLAFTTEKAKDTPQIIFRILQALVMSKTNIVVSGTTGSGKTELQKWLIGNIDENQKIISAEDTLEMFLKDLYPNKDIMSYRTTHKTTYTDIVKLALRNNPDWIIIAETRGSEAYHLIKAGQTGHNIITTLHSISARQSVERLIHMCKEDYDLEQVLLGKLITNTFDLGIHLEHKVSADGVNRYIAQIMQYDDYTSTGTECSPLYEIEYIVSDSNTVQKLHKIYPLNARLQSKLIKNNQIKVLNDFKKHINSK